MYVFIGEGDLVRLAVLTFLAGSFVHGQTPMGAGSSGSSRAISLPASGRGNQSGSVQTQQSAASGAGVDTVNSSVQVSGDFAGSVADRNLPNGPIILSLAEAVRRGLATNLGIISGNNSVQTARAQRVQELSTLLPNISANASETVTQVNLAAYGFQFKVPANLNFTIPSVVGPVQLFTVAGRTEPIDL